MHRIGRKVLSKPQILLCLCLGQQSHPHTYLEGRPSLPAEVRKSVREWKEMASLLGRLLTKQDETELPKLTAKLRGDKGRQQTGENVQQLQQCVPTCLQEGEWGSGPTGNQH